LSLCFFVSFTKPTFIQLSFYIYRSLKSNGIKENTSLHFETEFIATDLFLTELLHWFKYTFFKWVNSPICSECSMECIYESVELSTDPYCSKIELHR